MPALFGGQGEGSPEEQEQPIIDPFVRTYGWMANVARVAEYERLSLDQTYELPMLQFLNDLQYLKLKDDYESRQTRRHAAKS